MTAGRIPMETRGGNGVARGIGCMIAAVAVFAAMDTLIKWLSTDYGVMQIVFFRSLLALVPIGLFMWRNGGIASLATRRPLGHVARSVIGALAIVCFFYSFRHLPLADAYAIMFAAPLFVTAFSAPLLGEPVGWRRWSAVGVGFLGVLIVVDPSGGVFSTASLVCLVGTLLYALALIFVRKLSRTETNAAIVFYFTITCTVMGGALMIGDWVTPGPRDLAMLVMVGILGGCAQLLITQAFRLAPASVIAPFDYTAIVWGVLWGYFIFADLPTTTVLAGVAIVIASGLYILYRETRRSAEMPAADATPVGAAPAAPVTRVAARPVE